MEPRVVTVPASRRSVALTLILVGAAWFANACGPSRGSGPGVWHMVAPGESVWRIARYYGASPDDVVRANGIRNVRAVQIGEQLWIPKGRAGSGTGSLGGDVTPAVASPSGGRLATILDRRTKTLSSCEAAGREANLKFGWPVDGRLTSGFGNRRGGRHDGVDIGASKGTPIRAAEAGRVIYSGRLGDYGRILIIKHGGSWATVYAHNRRNRASRGDFVEKGEVIAEVGSSGNASGPHLHFEVRRSNAALDPLLCLR